MSSPSSKLELVRGDEARRFGVEEAAPSTHRSPGAGRRGDAGGGVCTRLEAVLFLPDIGADMLGLLVLIVDNGNEPSSFSRSRSVFV